MRINTLIADDSVEFIKYMLNVTSKIDTLKISHITTDGKETLKTIKENCFDLILLDLQMPNMNGIEIIENIYDENGNNMPKIIIISGELSSFRKIIKFPIVADIIDKLNDSTVLYNKIKTVADDISFMLNIHEIEKCIIKELNLLGYNFKYKGTQYLFETILYIYQNKKSELLENLENNVYKHIAFKNNKSLLNIKISIIKATNYMYLYQNKDVIEKYFSFNYKPTPKTVITTVLIKLNCLYL